MICPYCKHIIEDNARFCSECGGEISANSDDNSITSSNWKEEVKKEFENGKKEINQSIVEIKKQLKKKKLECGSISGIEYQVFLLYYWLSLLLRGQIPTKLRHIKEAVIL